MKKLAVIAGLAVLAAAGAAHAQPGAGHDPMARLMRADANNDGAITQAEARAAREAMFARMDSNGDGYLTIADREARRAAMQARREARRERFMNDRDTDNDGRISRAEFAADGAHFERLDTNDNGVLEPNELEAARQQMAARRAARQGQTE